jgi:hypothetical protein
MKRVADLLREGDPIAFDPDMPEADARRIRQQVLAHRGRARDDRGALWRGVAVFASVGAAAVALGTWLGDAGLGGTPGGRVRLAVVTATEPPPRQVQFVTPRGTRVVWVLQAETSDREGIR